MGAYDSGDLEDARTNALTRHFEQPEMRNSANLNARAIVFQRVFDAPFDCPIVAPLLHVNEIDDNKPSQIAQAQLPCDLVRSLEIGAQRRILDIVLARRTA